MQWASSITTRPAVRLSSGSTWSRNDGLFSRSGLTSSTSAWPAATSAYSASHAVVLAELMVRARMPAPFAASTWLRMSASSGDTITVGPSPRARSSAVAMKYTADLPQPVRCTTSARRRSATSARIAVHWSSRSRACSPARARRHVSASSRSSASSSVIPLLLPGAAVSQPGSHMSYSGQTSDLSGRDRAAEARLGGNRRGHREDQGHDHVRRAARGRPAAARGRPGRRPRAVAQFAARGGARAVPGQHPGRAARRRDVRDQPGAAAAAGGAELHRRLPPRRHAAGVPPGPAHPGARCHRDGGGADHRRGERRPARPARQHRPGPGGRGTGSQRPGVPPADRGLLGELGALLAARVDVRADHPGPGLARPDPDRRAGADAGRAPRHPGRARRARARGGQVLGDRAHRRRRAVASLGPVTDYVSVRDLSVAAVIGVHPWEREIEQTLLVSVDMVPETADVRTAAASDDLADALDYSAVAATIASVLRDGKFRLIETAAERVAERLLAEFPVSSLRLEVRKPIAADGYTAAVTIERSDEIS